MKKKLLILLIAVSFVFTGCVKDLLKKKQKNTTPTPVPEEKYYGTWKATKIAEDFNNNNTIDANEIFTYTGNSILQLSADKKLSYTSNSGTGNGSWVVTADLKQITITDDQGSLRLDYRTDTEFQTEPIPIPNPNGNGTKVIRWLIYNKQ
jgi:hypothetical protein